MTPALAAANNGNWRTARRWARLLGQAYRVRLTDAWDAGDEAAMIALHARRSAASIAAWRAAHPGRPLVVALTGTDLYRDIDSDSSARRSLLLADALGLVDEVGTLEAGKWADFVLWDIGRPAELVYRMGFNPMHARIRSGH